jgi:hypothetical protein
VDTLRLGSWNVCYHDSTTTPPTPRLFTHLRSKIPRIRLPWQRNLIAGGLGIHVVHIMRETRGAAFLATCTPKRHFSYIRLPGSRARRGDPSPPHTEDTRPKRNPSPAAPPLASIAKYPPRPPILLCQTKSPPPSSMWQRMKRKHLAAL